jgi:hypothetical protein
VQPIPYHRLTLTELPDGTIRVDRMVGCAVCIVPLPGLCCILPQSTDVLAAFLFAQFFAVLAQLCAICHHVCMWST